MCWFFLDNWPTKNFGHTTTKKIRMQEVKCVFFLDTWPTKKWGHPHNQTKSGCSSWTKSTKYFWLLTTLVELLIWKVHFKARTAIDNHEMCWRNAWCVGNYWQFGKSSHFNRVFHYLPSILGYPYFWKDPFVRPRLVDSVSGSVDKVCEVLQETVWKRFSQVIGS